MSLEVPKMTPTKEQKKWETQADVDNLIRANEVLLDKDRRKRALAEIDKRGQALSLAETQLEGRRHPVKERLGL